MERAAAHDPSNRPVRDALADAKKKMAAEARAADARTFANVDLNKHGLTSRRAAAAEQAKDRLALGFGRLLEGADAAAAAILEPLLASKLVEGAAGAGVRLQAAYGAGVAQYHLGRHAEADRSLGVFLEAKGQLEEEGKDVPIPAMGLPLVSASFFLLVHFWCSWLLVFLLSGWRLSFAWLTDSLFLHSPLVSLPSRTPLPLALFYAAHAAFSTGALPHACPLLTRPPPDIL